MTQAEVKKLGKEVKSGTRDMSAAAISNELKVYARQKWPLANDKNRKFRLKTLLGLTERRIKSFWEGDEAASPRGHEIEAIERLTGKKIGAAAELVEAQNEHRDLAELAASLQALLFGPDADFYRPQMDAIRAALVPAFGGAGSRSGDAGARDQERSEAAVADLFD